MQEHAERNITIDIAKGFAIFLVVLGHCGGISPSAAHDFAAANPLYAKYLLLHSWIYSFHMPLFFFLSGFLFHCTNKHRYKHVPFSLAIYKKVIRLILPYLTLSVIAFFAKSLFSSLAFRPITLSLSCFINSLIYPRSNPIAFFWFLPTLFIIFTFSYVLLHLIDSRTKIAIYFTTIVLVVTNLYATFGPNIPLFAITDVLYHLIFFWFGMLASHVKQLYKFMTSVKSFFVFFFLSCFGFMISQAFELNFILLLNIFGIVFSLSLSRNISKYMNKPLLFLSFYSYQIFLLSWFFQLPTRIILNNILHVSVWSTIVAMLIVGILGPYLCTRLLVRTPYPIRMACGLN